MMILFFNCPYISYVSEQKKSYVTLTSLKLIPGGFDIMGGI